MALEYHDPRNYCKITAGGEEGNLITWGADDGRGRPYFQTTEKKLFDMVNTHCPLAEVDKPGFEDLFGTYAYLVKKDLLPTDHDVMGVRRIHLLNALVDDAEKKMQL